jgi:membrane protein implicated in regulation of membrane protease activity
VIFLERIIVWAAILVISVVVECCTTALVSIWFAPSAAVCVLLELFGVKNIYIQLAVFILLTALLVYFLRNKIRESFNRSSTKTNVDSLIGKTAVVEEDITDGLVGRVKVGGMSWAAYADENVSVTAGEKVKILEISGVKLLCEPVSK